MQNSTSRGFRLSPQQKQIWISQQAFPGQSFCAVGVFTVSTSLDGNRLQRAFRILIGQHEILRTTFARPAGIKIPFQIISENTNFFWQSVHLTALEQGQQHERIDALVAAERKRRLTLDDGPVLRCQLANLSPRRAALIVSLPAICADSVTLKNLTREVFRIYESDEELEAPDEVVQYADFAEWQNQVLESADAETVERRTYWNKKVLSDPVVLPLERRAVATRVPEYDSVAVDTDEDLLNRLEAIASENDVALVHVLLVCWQTLISRLSGRRDFIVYNRCNARKIEDLQRALGPFDRYLPLRAQPGNTPLSRQLSLVADELRQAEEFQEYADANDPALFSGNAIAFELEHLSVFATKTLSVSPSNLFVFSNPFKLKLSCIVSGKQLSLHLQYDCTSFHEETIDQFGGYFRRLLEATATARADTLLTSIDFLSDDDRRLLVELNDTSSVYSRDKCVHELFEAQVASTPTACAVACHSQRLTYEELNARANQVANLLLNYGVEPGACVAMCMTPSVDTIVVLLGILKAGAAYLPLDPQHPLTRLIMQLTKSQAPVCFTNVGGIVAALESHTRVIELSTVAELLRNQPDTNPVVATTSEALVYAIFTSGSTGTPKGVAVRHRNLGNYTQGMLKLLHVETPLQFATVSTISADLGNTCIFPALLSGGCLHIIGHDVALEPRLFSDYLSRNPIDVLKITPSHLQAMLSDSEENNLLPSKFLIVGGEAFSRQLRDSVMATPHTCKVINHYGPTETTVGSLTFDVDEQNLLEIARTVPIGRPLTNTRVYVLDQHLRQVPTGVAGELYIGGAGVAAGYLNDPDQTAARFIPDPFSDEPGGRLYRTGDLARILPDGNVEFLGRSDLQVKVRGYRIEPGEIETVLAEHALVNQAVVILRDDRFVAYVMSSQLRPANADQLRQYMKERLPDYMVPAAIVILRSFPTTPNGKVDRAALPQAELTKSRVMVTPQTSVEKELAAIWSQLLRIAEISIHDNFFDLGGHSLLATQVMSRIRKVFNKDLPLRTIFDAPTIAKLAHAIEAATLSDDIDLRAALDDLESLSNEEAERLLQEEERSRI